MDPQFKASIEALSDWVGHERIIEDEISLTSVRKIAALFDLEPATFEVGTTLPAHWFSLFFADIVRQRDLGPDGHPAPGVILPPIPLPRRMGAGRRVKISGKLRAGQPARRIARVESITPKLGRSGHIAVLTMRHTIESDGECIAVDEFDAIYRGEVAPGAATTASPAAIAPATGEWTKQLKLDESLVFRFSSVTWNAHRIHYDADYARDAEGYQGTVQNGGLTISLLLDAALEHGSGELRGFTARLTGPLFVGDTVTLCGEHARDGVMQVWATNQNGELCGRAQVELDS